MAGTKLAGITTFFRVLQFVWALIYVIEIGMHTLNNKEYGGKLDYMPLVTMTGLGIAFLLLTVPIHAFGVLGSFTGNHQSPKVRLIRQFVELFNFVIWFINLWVVFYLPKLAAIAEDPQSDAITDTLYWSNPWCIPTVMMNVVLVGLVIGEARTENKAERSAHLPTTNVDTKET